MNHSSFLTTSASYYNDTSITCTTPDFGFASNTSYIGNALQYCHDYVHLTFTDSHVNGSEIY